MDSFEHTVTRNLQCPICLDSLTDPKLLSCSHTFCKQCLLHILSLHNASTETPSKPNQTWQPSSNALPKSIVCPVCRKCTDLKDSDVSLLPTNVSLKSIVLDVRDSGQPCDICEEMPAAEKFCCNCGKNMCKACHSSHNSWKPNLDHRVVDVEDIRKGKVVLERKVYCRDHRPGDMEYICTDVCMTCKKFICMRCRIFNHEKVGHTAVHTTEYEDFFQQEAESLKEQAESKISDIKKHKDFVQEEQKKSANHINGVKLKIGATHGEISKLMNKKRANLISRCDHEKGHLRKEFNARRVNGEKLVSRIGSSDKLTSKIAKLPLNLDKVTIRESLRDHLKDVLKVEVPQESDISDMSVHAESLEFEEDKRLRTLQLGKVGLKK